MNSPNIGTPRSLGEAIGNGLTSPYVAALKKTLIERIKPHIIDYLNQRIGTLMLEHPEAAAVLKKLKESI